ncbi:MAG: AbrB/MazE/SpoVT family DNA-binding domain-containing protein [Acidobacteriota bacterium]
MQVKLEKSGEDIALKIPKSIAAKSKIKQSSVVNLSVVDGNIIVKPVTEKEYTLEELLKGVTRKNIHKETDFGNPAGKELL